MTKSKFIVVEHHAVKARLHYDLRFQIPHDKNWMSFAVRKGVPLTSGSKVLAVRTHDHSEEEALFLGRIEQGYGKGDLKLWDKGDCEIIKFGTGHITIKFNGHKVKGVYHLVSTGVIDRDYKRQTYILFKGKDQLNEFFTRAKNLDRHQEDEEQITSKIPWAMEPTYKCPPNYTFNLETKKCVKNTFDDQADGKNNIKDDIRPIGVGEQRKQFLEKLLWALQPTYECPEWFTYDPVTKKCIKNPDDPIGKSMGWSLAKHFNCPDDTTYNFLTKKCMSDPHDDELDEEGLNRLFKAALDNA